MLTPPNRNNQCMRTLAALPVVVFALAGLASGVQTANAGQQPEEVKANAVLAEARKALGGEDKLAAVLSSPTHWYWSTANDGKRISRATVTRAVPDGF